MLISKLLPVLAAATLNARFDRSPNSSLMHRMNKPLLITDLLQNRLERKKPRNQTQ